MAPARLSRGDAAIFGAPSVVGPRGGRRGRIRERPRGSDPGGGEGSLYRTRDLVPGHLMTLLTQGKVIVTNWHVFEPQAVNTGGVSSRVSKAGVVQATREWI